MGVGWQFGDRECMSLLSSSFAQRMTAANVDWCSPAQVWQGKVHPPIATKSRSQE
jgi:hypothetical protein